MSLIKIEAQIDATNPKHVEAACTFLQSIGNSVEVVKPTPKTAKPVETKKETTKKEADKSSVTLNEIRVAIQSKTKDEEHGERFRPLVKRKLTELGANNASTLVEDKYEEFMEFLNNLK